LLRLGKHAEAADVFRQLLLLHPKDVFLTKVLCRALMAVGHGEEAQVAWRRMLDAHPNDPEAWDGYPQLCLFLGRDDEYCRVRTACLKRFADSKDPVIATRTARACLLISCTEDELRMASALTEVATASRRPEHEWLRPHLVFIRGLLDYRRGRLDSAIALMEEDAPGTWNAAYELVRAMARSRQGRTADARRAFTAAVLGFDWSVARSDDPYPWSLHVLRREAEAMILPTLPAFLQGTYQSQQEDERLALLAARLALYQAQGLRGSAARLYTDLFRAEPNLAEAIAKGSRYYAARAAALAGCGKGNDAGQLDDKERALRRRQALAWLRQDLAACSEMADNRETQTRAQLRERLRNWQADYDLVGVRARDGLSRLPDEEREQWERLWSAVDALLRRVSGPD
jgi:serine/threonine-protein kinase